ncbi:MAG: GNAT family N-acetyltransferase [Rhodobacterales bacterium]|nr:GNAT family N-acetyltransferase [Rhodobacterales bacterium]NCT12479.1 GNAT family N-acetyltransferase [Rhodobacterales bacterium]
MLTPSPSLTVRIATQQADVVAAQRLRYQVFVKELGGDGPMVDHSAGIERDAFDPSCDHLVLVDPARREGDHVIGSYRLMRGDQAAALGRFYSEDEYDLAPLRATGRRLLELGRSCLHVDYRGGAAMYHLWHGLADYVTAHGVEILFGVASFHGTDPEALALPLSYLHHNHLAPPDLRVRARVHARMDLLPRDRIDRKRAMIETPALIKAYLRLGGHVGDGAFVDHPFNTTDVCLVMDTARMNDKQRDLYTRPRRT